MGCDITCCIEYSTSQRPDGSWEHFWPFAHRVALGRDYYLFALMAGVRNDAEIEPVAEPKGLPPDVSHLTIERSGFRIDDDLAAYEVEGYCSRFEAEQWVRSKSSVLIGSDVVSDPDWHSHSWLNTGEMEEVQRRSRMLDNEHNLELDAVVAAMKVLDNGQNGRSRLVFWFHN